MKAKFIKEQKGFVMSDALLAVLILIMFTGLITSLIYNIVLTSKRIKINSQEIAYITEVFNYAEIIDYEEVTTQNLIEYINEKEDTKEFLSAGTNSYNLTTPYKMTIKVDTYEPEDATFEKKDLIKIITVDVECTLAKKTYSINMKSLRKIKNVELDALL